MPVTSSGRPALPTNQALVVGVMKREWEDCARLLQAVAHPVRLAILAALAEHSRCVKDLNALVPIAQPRLSQPMAALRRSELVDCHVNGTLRCYYILRPALVRRLLRLLCAEHPPQRRDRRSVLREIRRVDQARADSR